MQFQKNIYSIFKTPYAAKHIIFKVISLNCITFAPTVHTTLPIRTASQGVSFAFMTFQNTRYANRKICWWVFFLHD